MEDLPFFHEQDEQFSAGGLLFNEQGNGIFFDKPSAGLFDNKDDLKLFFDWQTHVDDIQDSFCESLDLEYNYDLKTEPPDLDCPILSNALSCLPVVKEEPDIKPAPVEGEKILFPGDVEPLRVSSSIQTDNVLKRITQARSVLINGEKEILGKNIIGLHSLNELKTSPDEKCQITSTVINGKRYKIIIRPKSSSRTIQQVAKSEGSTLGMESLKTEQADAMISELQNGDYDVLGHDGMPDLWQLSLGEEANVGYVDVGLDLGNEREHEPIPDPPRVPPLRIKIPKIVKKHKSKRGEATQNCIPLETKAEDQEETRERTGGKRPSLLRAVPRRVEAKGGTRMQDAAIAISRNKLLSIVSGGDSVQLDHDYCSYRLLRENLPSLQDEELPTPESSSPSPKSEFMEKNPRKDSGLESGGVSDASEECHTPDPRKAPPSLLAPQLASKLLEEQRRNKNHLHITKMAAALFRAANAITSGKSTVTTANSTIDCDISPSENGSIDNGASHDNNMERPKKKLKLEEYRSRRSDKDKDQSSNLESTIEVEEKDNNLSVTKDNAQIASNNESQDVFNSKPQDSDENTAAKAVNKVEVPVVKVPQECKEVVAKEEGHANREDKEEMPRKRSSFRTRRSSSSSTSGDRSRRRKISGSRRGRSGSRDRRRSVWSPSRRSSSRDSSSSSGESPARRRSFRYRRRSRSRSSSRGRSRGRAFVSRRRNCNSYRRHSTASRRSRSPIYSQREKQKQIEERRVIYVGRIAEGTTNNQLRQRFNVFGPIVDISVHFREHGDNYGFVTFAYKEDAYQAVEHGNDDPNYPIYDLCFGGRRSFCKQRYSDLDGMPTSYSGFKDTPVVRSQPDSFDFDLLLKVAKDNVRMRKEKT